MDKRIDGSSYQTTNEDVESNTPQTVEFESAMPRIEEDDVEFVPDEQLEDEVAETDEI